MLESLARSSRRVQAEVDRMSPRSVFAVDDRFLLEMRWSTKGHFRGVPEARESCDSFRILVGKPCTNTRIEVDLQLMDRKIALASFAFSCTGRILPPRCGTLLLS